MPNFPEVIPLPDGFQPEGIAMGRGTTIYAGSTSSGAIYEANVRTGEGRILVPAHTGRAALGLKFDARSGYLFVAGGPTGYAYVYDSRTGQDVNSYLLSSGPSFINDVVVTREAAYFTDSFSPVLYRLPLLPNGVPAGPVEQIPLSGDFVFVAGGFNANGIEATPNGQALLVVNTTTGSLYRVDPMTGDATEIVLSGGTAASGDGLLLIGQTLYVAQNFLNQMTVIRLDPGLTTGAVVQVVTNANFDIPTTLAAQGASLYAVNARFTTPPTPGTEYWIARLARAAATP
jgi:hypothetical protein